jgi:hypothetical protein
MEEEYLPPAMDNLRRLSSAKWRPKYPFDEDLKEDAVLEKLGYQQGWSTESSASREDVLTNPV